MRAYLAVLSLGFSASIGMAILNYLVDPWQLHASHPDRLANGPERLSGWGKAYALMEEKPRVVFIGNSRSELGLAPSDIVDGPAYNAALSGASLADAAAMLEHTLRVAEPKLVIWGIDAPSFSLERGVPDLADALATDGASFRLSRVAAELERGFLFDMTRANWNLLTGGGGGCRSSLLLRGQRDAACMDGIVARHGGLLPSSAERTREFVRGSGPTGEAYQLFAATLAHACEQGIALRIYVNPTHAVGYEMWFETGALPRLELWLRALARLGAGLRATGCNVRILDFAGYNQVTMEALPLDGRSGMTNYWEVSHYRANVGRRILLQLEGFDDFGVELTPASVERHLQQQRQARTAFQAMHWQQLALARKWIRSVP